MEGGDWMRTGMGRRTGWGKSRCRHIQKERAKREPKQLIETDAKSTANITPSLVSLVEELRDGLRDPEGLGNTQVSSNLDSWALPETELQPKSIQRLDLASHHTHISRRVAWSSYRSPTNNCREGCP